MRKLPAYTVYLVITGVFSVLFTMMAFISALYRVQTAGLNPLQLVLLGTALELSVFFFEIPTGLVADLYSRRLSVIVGYAVIGAGFMLEGAFTFFSTIALAQIVWGAGYTFISGAQDAWLADEIGEAQLAQAYLRASQVGRGGALAGILISMGLGSLYLGLPIFLAGVLLVGLALFLVLFMPETGFAPTPRPERTTWQKMVDTFGDGLQLARDRPTLILILAITFILGLSSEGLDRLWEAHMLANFAFPAAGSLEPVFWFGAMSVTTLLLGIAVTEVVRRRLAVESIEVTLWVQFAINLITIAGIVVLGLAARFGAAVIAIIAVQVSRSAYEPLYRAWINKEMESRVRATVLSMNGQLNAVGQIAGGPLIGVVATSLSLRAAMVGVALLWSPVLLLYALALQRHRLVTRSFLAHQDDVGGRVG